MAGNLLDEFKLRLSADALPGAKVYGDRKATPALAIRIKDNQPRFVVYTNVENDKNNGIIEAAMDSFVFFTVIQGLRDVAEGRSPGFVVNNRGYSFGAQGRSSEPFTLSQTRVGVNDDGIICISVIAKNRPEAIFKFGPHEWHPMLDRQGNSLSIKEQTRMYALAYATIMEKAVIRILGDEFISYADIKARKEANRNNRGGGGNRNYQANQSNTSNYNSAPSNDKVDDNIPW